MFFKLLLIQLFLIQLNLNFLTSNSLQSENISIKSHRTPIPVRTCESIQVDLCKNIGYNVTGTPNLIGHETQQEARLQIQTFIPLIQYKCSSQLQFFLCSVYVPMCTEKVIELIGPCRPLCESVRSRCEPVLSQFEFLWPDSLDCNKFPAENNEQHMCMKGPLLIERDHLDAFSSNFEPNFKLQNSNHNSEHGLKFPKLFSNSRGQGSRLENENEKNHFNYRFHNSSSRKNEMCSNFKFSKQYYYITRTERCAHNCSADILFSSDSKYFSSIWICIWSLLCFFSTLFTFLTFSINPSNFKYPERAIIFISINYNIYSFAHFLRLIIGRKAASCYLDPQYNVLLMIQEGLDNSYCTFIFLLLYFFGMSSILWWLILTLTWFFATRLEWTTEHIEKKCSYYHITAWGIPFLKIIAILILGVVDTDELTGTCYVGNQSRSALMKFVIIPSALYLIIGCVFLFTGFCSIYKYRQSKFYSTCESSQRVTQESILSSQTSHPHLLLHKYASNGKITDDQKLLLLRIGVFALFYIIPATCVLVTNIYEYLFRDKWYKSDSTERPNMEIFTLKIFMSLVVGIKSGIWIWSSKAPFAMWREVGKRLNKKDPNYSISNLPSQNQLINLDNKRYSSRQAETSVQKTFLS